MKLDYKQIGRNLARRRKELNLRQVQVCERADINSKYLSCIETARSIPSMEVFLKLCNALETTPDRIMMGSIHSANFSQSDEVLIERFHELSKENQVLCLGFIDMLRDRFQEN